MQYDSKNLLDFVLEIGLEWLMLYEIRTYGSKKNATMEFWKLLCLLCSYNRTQR